MLRAVAASLMFVVLPVAAEEKLPRAEDVGSIDGIMRAFYDVISGPAGHKRDWQRDRSLYIPGVRFVAMSLGPGGQPVAEVMDHPQYVQRSGPWMEERGFFEEEIHRIEKRFGNLAHVFSAYEWRNQADGPVGGRGVNSVELYWDETRWWIAGAIWEGERPDNPIPKDLLP
jgi:hypothetical protein